MATISKEVPFNFGVISGSVSIITATKARSRTTSTIGVCNHENHQPTKTRQEIVCDGCAGIPLSPNRAYSIDGGYAILTKEDMATVETKSVADFKAIATTLYPADEVELSSTPGDKVYYLTPNKGSEASYGIMAKLVANHPELAFITKYAARTKTAMYRLLSAGDVLIMQERIESEKEAVAKPEINFQVDPSMLELSETLLKSMKVETFTSDLLADEREVALKSIADTKPALAIVGEKTSNVTAEAQSAGDLKSALEAALKAEAAKQKRAATRRRNAAVKTERHLQAV